jgi:hypothetical protein
MSQDQQLLQAYLQKLGLRPETASVYLALQAYGSQTISELARRSGVERVQIYRLMDELKASGLIEAEVHYKRTLLKAAPIANLQLLVTKKEQELAELQRNLPMITKCFKGESAESATTKVRFYEGADGLKQMIWNQTKGISENLSILYDNMQHNTGLAFFSRWVRHCNERSCKFRGIIGDHFVTSQQTWYARHQNERLAHWESRYMPEHLFPITHSTVIYGDVTAYFNWKDGEIFGIEIYNQQIADAQRQFFEMLWRQGVPVDDLVGPSEHP